jgi:hypothetical protein
LPASNPHLKPTKSRRTPTGIGERRQFKFLPLSVLSLGAGAFLAIAAPAVHGHIYRGTKSGI